MIKKLLRPIVKLLTSGELVERLDKNKDGKVSYDEVIEAGWKTWIEILGEIAIKYVPFLYAAL